MSTHDHGPNFVPRLGVLIAAALLLHALILGGAGWAWPSTTPPPLPAAALRVRVVEPVAPAAIEPIVMAAAPPPLPAAVRAMPAPKPIALAQAAPAVERPAVVAPARDMPVSPPAAPTSADDDAIPLYRTELPPATTLRYEVSRGLLRGTGELVWRPQGERYELKLDFRLSGLTILSQTSAGSFDAAGIAPLRFTDQRPRRGTTAANFQRNVDKITYSGSQSEFVLRPGAQDRLSWMLQLAAIVSAEPQLATPGAKVVMYVTGSRGDAGVWVFRSIGTEPVDARGGAIDALKFVREPREPYDTTVQVWLDPQQHHLPVRATQKSGGSDEGYELRLVEAIAPN
ncbi:MAG: DUF3108 domain-containing protein [Burkholderiales bacterium]